MHLRKVSGISRTPKMTTQDFKVVVSLARWRGMKSEGVQEASVVFVTFILFYFLGIGV
jgi:hypothetical protein